MSYRLVTKLSNRVLISLWAVPTGSVSCRRILLTLGNAGCARCGTVHLGALLQQGFWYADFWDQFTHIGFSKTDSEQLV